MKTWCFILFLQLLLFQIESPCQQTIILQPGPQESKNTFFQNTSPSSSFDSTGMIWTSAWTHNGNLKITRSVLNFDFSQIPAGAQINSALLSLYFDPTNTNGTHSTADGSNASWIERITTPWVEDLTTWQNQPTTSSVNRVDIPATLTNTQDFPNIDVTDLVQDMINDPANSHGFYFKLQVEQFYRRMGFASSDNWDPAKRPKLEITYLVSGIFDMNSANDNLQFYPNPFNQSSTLNWQPYQSSDCKLFLFSDNGILVRFTDVPLGSSININKGNLSEGNYFYKIIGSNSSLSGKLVVN